MTARKGVTRFPKGLCSKEGKVKDIFSLFISISRWNQMHIESVPWNNEAVIFHLEDNWRRIIALDIGCQFDLVVWNLGITLRVEV